MINGKRKKYNEDNILNYFGRNTSEIGKTSYVEYIYWFYKMQRSGKDEFYGEFFSKIKAGKRNRIDFYNDEDCEYINDTTKIERLIADNFVINYYDTLIPNYDFYSDTIKEYKISEKGDIVNPYYDKRIIDDELVSKLEETMPIDIYSIDGEIKKVYNPYVYGFDKTIISRYKVLRNLSILKHKYGYINEDMLLTAIVYNSYIDKDTFDMISERIKKEGIVKWTIWKIIILLMKKLII